MPLTPAGSALENSSAGLSNPSPALTGTPTAPTAAVGDNSTTISTTAFVTTAVANAVAGVNPAAAVQAATNAILPNTPTYNNGVSGIGATITAGVTNTALVVDGYTPILNDRILVKNESSGGGLGAGKNGVYFVSQIASLGLAWILTRALDYDQPSDINNTGAIPVVNGTANAITQWVLTSSITAVDGTQALTYAEFSVNPATLAPLASPAFTGTPTAPTQPPGDATTALATDAFVAAALKPNPTFCSIIEEFIGGLTTAGAIASLGWFVDAIGSTPTFTGTQAVTPNLGIIQFNTAVAATAGQGGGMRLISLASSSGTVVNNLQSNIGWELQWIFKLSQTTNTRFRIGIDTTDTIVVGSNGLHLRYDTNASFADTNFIFESVFGGTATTVDTTIAVDTNWHRVKISSQVSGTAIVTLYDASGNVQATKTLAISFVTSAGMIPVVILATDATAQKSVQLDYMSFYYPGLAR